MNKNNKYKMDTTSNEKVIDSTNLNDSPYTENPIPFSVKIELFKKTTLEKIKNERNLSLTIKEDFTNIKYENYDDTILIFNVFYETQLQSELDTTDKVNCLEQQNNSLPEHKKFTWLVYKTYDNLKKLLLNVDLKLLNDNISPSITQKINRIKTFDNNDYKNTIEVWIETINEMLTLPTLRKQIFFLEFLEISRHSLDCFKEGNKPKEGYILKRAGTRKKSLLSCICSTFSCFCKNWQLRWFVLKDDMICYLDNSSSNIGKDVFWFDQELIIHKDYDGHKNTLGLINGSRTLLLKFNEEFEREIWYELLIEKINAYQSNVKNIYESFANEKNSCNARWFVEANTYFSDLYDQLMKAKESIYIAGWWISPELFLKRPVKINSEPSKACCLNKIVENVEEEGVADSNRNSLGSEKAVNKNEESSDDEEDHMDNFNSRLMDLLKLKASEGVMIHLLIYKEVKLALSMNSNHTKKTLNNLHPNIKVTRHPKKNLDLLWSHHEKIVIIDQRVGYVGGVDLCWGRYDTKDHKLSEDSNYHKTYHWPGIDYCNNRIADFANVNLYNIDSVDRNAYQRMPWHDIHVYLEGPVVSDLCRHFVERWNYARTNNFKQNKKYTIMNGKFY